MRNAARVKEWGDDLSLHVAFTVVFGLVLIGVMNSLTVNKIEAMKRDNGKPRLVLLGPANSEVKLPTIGVGKVSRRVRTTLPPIDNDVVFVSSEVEE